MMKIKVETIVYTNIEYIKERFNVNKHLMSGPQGKQWGSRGNKTHCFPRGRSLSVLLYLPTQNRTIHGCQFTTLLQNVTNPSNLHIKQVTNTVNMRGRRRKQWSNLLNKEKQSCYTCGTHFSTILWRSLPNDNVKFPKSPQFLLLLIKSQMWRLRWKVTFSRHCRSPC